MTEAARGSHHCTCRALADPHSERDVCGPTPPALHSPPLAAGGMKGGAWQACATHCTSMRCGIHRQRGRAMRRPYGPDDSPAARKRCRPRSRMRTGNRHRPPRTTLLRWASSATSVALVVGSACRRDARGPAPLGAPGASPARGLAVPHSSVAVPGVCYCNRAPFGCLLAPSAPHRPPRVRGGGRRHRRTLADAFAFEATPTRPIPPPPFPCREGGDKRQACPDRLHGG
jgi:hypothetical protein